MDFSKLINELSAEIGLSVVSDIISPFEIVVDALAVTLTQEDRGTGSSLVLSCLLGAIPEEHELDAYRVLLDANTFWNATADCTLGVNAQTRQAYICYRIMDDGISGERLADILESFVYVAGNWANFIEGLNEFDVEQGLQLLDQNAFLRA
ncbi:type III secretion system chaperone [Rhizobium oryzicola]|uniref:Type III secretion system chaperone n=1 Tax=Rhizobium oryzicola TaxID=1232668 RepID=A0ABT8SXL3_9HYPH|nr:type III secretion system chaperone [Rhizobium oryzicola]MDO1583200.1 type III secretion system chaperone [Rhizobium oryzicola]